MSLTEEQGRRFLRADRVELAGRVLAFVAVAVWLWFFFLLLAPYEVEGRVRDVSCPGPLGASLSEDPTPEVCEASQRGAPELLAVLGLANLLSLIALAMYVLGTMPTRIHALANDVVRRHAKGTGRED